MMTCQSSLLGDQSSGFSALALPPAWFSARRYTFCVAFPLDGSHFWCRASSRPGVASRMDFCTTVRVLRRISAQRFAFWAQKMLGRRAQGPGIGCRSELRAQGPGLQAQASRLRAQGSGLRAEGSGLRAQASGFKALDSGLRIQSSGLKAQGSKLRAQCSGGRHQSSGLRSHGSRVRGQGSGLKAEDSGPKAQG